ncbi:related to 3-ketoacyl-acyl carrier protein reductase [Rhynchosporium secalis]|uniref:3-oxoacyl-[acyl-carrier-protein] reductase n=1 Tax=Rhynchosporium secalis TaxID=38038 RepID=A0A1E1M691_RHYSE|nr:related to 3-ketoacyl-acyl carrier protein reductase [Rhynchosporium secalis]
MPSNLTTDLSPHLALVTGASGGIGKATCLALALLGCSVAVHYHSSEDKATTLVKELIDKGVRAGSFKADLTNYHEVRSLHAEFVSSLGHPTILFNNAGLTLQSGIKKITGISIEEFEHTWKANCGSALLLTQLFLPEMERQGWGRVIFCSSVAGCNGGVVGPHYASSKSALHGLVHWLAGAYATSGVTINGVAPALIQETTMLPGNNEELAKKIPIGRLGFPDEVAETVLWMVKTGCVTNKVIAIDGGFFIQ